MKGKVISFVTVVELETRQPDSRLIVGAEIIIKTQLP
jgi:hypothetical protein